ncbi:MAG TPA: NAD-dependent epimerase/dehydratase family protein [Vicinamibacteria bacterium]|nr:NAD-dependent epimerase/dehydratase family protein [Vicinamibacteria bacterium]
MKVILFGATGMVGQGALRECLLDPEVEKVLAVGRRATGQGHDKLREIVHTDFLDFSAIEDELAGYDACLYCLGVSSAGMSEPDYHRVTYDVTMAAASALVRRSPALTLVYVSGAHTDSTERGRVMWARVKGKTENALLRMPFKAAYMFRPGYIQPLHGIVSRTKLLRVLYAVVGPLYPVWKALFPDYVTTTEQLARAMIQVARHGAPKRVLENRDINALAGESSSPDAAPR